MTTQIRKDQVANDQIGDDHIDPSQPIVEAHLDLNYATHDNSNDPTSDQKAALNNSPNPLTAANPAVDKQYADAIAAGIEMQDGIILDKDLTAPPGSPGTGDMYIVATGATGAWSGHDGEIATYNVATWDFDTPSKGWLYYVEDEGSGYIQTQDTGPWSWTLFFTPSDVTAGAGLVKNGAAIDVGAGNGIQVNTDDVEVVYEADNPLALGSAAPGTANEAARGDHVHAHGDQAGGSLHADATGAVDGFMSSADKVKLDAMPGTRAIEDFDSSGQTLFTLAVAPTSDAYCTVYKNGVRQRLGASYDYQRAGTAITFNNTVGAGQNVSVEYWH